MQDPSLIRQPATTTPAGTTRGAARQPPSLWSDYLDLSAVLKEPEEDLDFVLPGLLAGTVGVLVSAGGTGKSMLALGLAASVAAGRDPWCLTGSEPRQGPVIVLALEDPKVILGRRLRALEASRPGVMTGIAQGQLRVAARQGTGFNFGSWDPKNGFDTSKEYQNLALEVEQLAPRLLIIDTLNRALGGLPENDNAVQGAVVNLIERLILPTKTAALVLHHTSKAAALSGQADVQQSARGAGAISDNARYQMNLVGLSKEKAAAKNVNSDHHRWVQSTVTKSNYAPSPPDYWLYREKGGVLSRRELPQREKAASKKTLPYDED